jgi:internalin A
LKSLELLECLDVSHNKVSSLDSLRDLVRLRVLRCNSNNIESIEPLSRLRDLEILWISNNNINWTDFIYVTNLNNLKHLCKSGNPSDEKLKTNEVSAYLSNHQLRRFIFAVYFGIAPLH